MRNLVLSQPEDSCMHIARQCVLILLMLMVELLSRLLSVSSASNRMINGFAHFCSAPKARPLSGNNQRGTHLSKSYWSPAKCNGGITAEHFQSAVCVLFHQYVLYACAQYMFISELRDGCGSLASLSHRTTHSLLDANRYIDTQAHRNTQTHT